MAVPPARSDHRIILHFVGPSETSVTQLTNPGLRLLLCVRPRG